jgi:hypothetical protein
MEKSGQSGQSGHTSCVPFEGFDRCKPLAVCHVFAHIDGGPLASDHPPPLLFVMRVRQPPVAAVFEKEGGLAGVFAVFQPLNEAVAIEAAGSADDVADDGLSASEVEDRLASKMTSGQVAEARRLARGWKPTK